MDQTLHRPQFRFPFLLNLGKGSIRYFKERIG